MACERQVPIKYTASTKQRLYLVSFLMMEVYNLLNAACSASLVLLYKVRTGNSFQKCVVIWITLWVQIISDGEGLLNGSHAEVAHLRELGGVLVHCVAEALVASVH